MEKKKNIIHITGANTYACMRECERLVEVFKSRHSDGNIDRYRIEEIIDWSSVIQKSMTPGLFATKRLIVMSGGYTNIGEDGVKSKKTNHKQNHAETMLEKIAQEANEDTFIILKNIIISPKSGLQNWLITYADTRTYNDLYSTTIWSKYFPHIDESVIKKLITRYQKGLTQIEEIPSDISYEIALSLEKLSYIQTPTENDIERSIDIKNGGRIFDLMNTILSGNKAGSLEEFRVLLNTSSIYALLPSILSLMRSAIYVKYLSSLGHNATMISKITGIHNFVIDKSIRAPISYESLRKFYEKCIFLSRAYKSGKGLEDPELGRIFHIERALLELQK